MNPRRNPQPVTARAYHWVDMGALNRLNGPASYPFPTDAAAQRFAQAHRERAPHRTITVAEREA